MNRTLHVPILSKTSSTYGIFILAISFYLSILSQFQPVWKVCQNSHYISSTHVKFVEVGMISGKKGTIKNIAEISQNLKIKWFEKPLRETKLNHNPLNLFFTYLLYFQRLPYNLQH